jgi:hypothetical protein
MGNFSVPAGQPVLRLAGSENHSQEQVLLERYFPEHNRKFSEPAARSEPA